MGLTVTGGITWAGGVNMPTPAGSIRTTGNQGRLATPASTNLALGTSNFTIEGWFQPVAKTNTNPILISNGNFTTNRWQLNDRNGSSTKFTVAIYNFSTSDGWLTSTTTPVNDTWYYISVTRSGNTFWLHVNGTQESTNTNAGSVDGGGSQTIYLAGDASQLSLTNWNGYQSTVRIVIGTAVYGAGNYTPPRVPNTAIANTQLLLNAYGQDPFKDYSANNFTMVPNTVSSQPSWSSLNPLTSQP
jgi:hypothetical protein